MKGFFCLLFPPSSVGDKQGSFSPPFAIRWKFLACSFLIEDLPQGTALFRSLSSSSSSCTSSGPCLLSPVSNFCYEQMPSKHSWTCLISGFLILFGLCEYFLFCKLNYAFKWMFVVFYLAKGILWYLIFHFDWSSSPTFYIVSHIVNIP